MQYDLTNFFEAIIALIVTIITSFLIPFIKSKISEANYDRFLKIAEIAVMSAEEMARAGVIDKSKKYLYVKTQLEEHGCTYDSEKIESLINGAVWDVINHDKQ